MNYKKIEGKIRMNNWDIAYHLLTIHSAASNFVHFIPHSESAICAAVRNEL